jgi:SAM-dependent methyltransferase
MTLPDAAPSLGLAPGVPPDYYERISEVEREHWWYRGTREIALALLGSRLDDARRILDAGCGTGGFLRWALDKSSFDWAVGVDIGSAAIDLAQRLVPEAEFRVAPLSDLPLADASFDLTVMNDVLQHVPEGELEPSLSELRRTLAPGGVLLIRTNGARTARREREDWRAYDAGLLRSTLEAGGFRVERITYANAALSLWGDALGRTPRAPTEERHGIPEAPGRVRSAIASALMRAEARLLARPGLRLPYGHTLFAVARPADG